MSSLEVHTPLRGRVLRSARSLTGASGAAGVRREAEITKSTSPFGSPHTSSKTSMRVQLRSPCVEVIEEEKSEAQKSAPLSDSCASLCYTAAASSTPAPSACPSLPLPFPHRRPPMQNVLHHMHAYTSRTVGVSRAAFKRQLRPQRFGRFELRHSVSPCDELAPNENIIALQQKRGKVVEIISVANFAFVLTNAGVCTAYDNRTTKRLCLLNVLPDEVIRSLFHNKTNNSLITVSAYRNDNFMSLRCRSTSFEAIAACKPELGCFLFSTESLQFPGFVEFDDVNKKVLTFSATTKKYRVWELSSYQLMYDIDNTNIDEVKVSPGTILLILTRTSTSCPLKILSIETGEVLRDFSQPLLRNQRLQFIEQFNEKLLIKQRQTPLNMIDLTNPSLTRTVNRFATPSAFIFLYEHYYFLAFIKREIAVWNFEGKRVTQFEDHFNWYPDCNTNNIYISQDQDMIVSYCLTPEQTKAMQNKVADPLTWKQQKSRTGSVNISCVFTGKCFAKIEKRKQLKYPFHLLTRAQQTTALADYKKRHGTKRFQTMLETMQMKLACGISMMDPDVMMTDETMTDAPLPTPSPQPGSSSSSESSTRALQLQHDRTQLQNLLAIDAEAQQRRQRAQEAQLDLDEDSTPWQPDDDEEDDDADMMDDDEPTGRAHPAVADASDLTSDDDDDEVAQPEERDEMERNGVIHSTRVLFPFEASAPSAPSVASHQFPPLELELPDIAAYREHNRQVRARNKALRNVTAVFFNEERNEVYTGNSLGQMHVWSL